MAPNSDYLALIQGVINRMANNAFLVKGWSITLTAALLTIGGALISAEGFGKQLLFIVNFFCLLGFIWIDAYFYYNEKKYREIYNYARDESRFKESDLYSLDVNLITKETSGTRNKKVLGFIMTTAVYPVYLIQLILVFFVCMVVT